ncbi:MAG: hypothetical protein CO186_01960 [Zetaproteobacteria bacterium CG_4_9_14_3_um_filter_49_83]|nr:MAG: hypothetical protein AUJ56_01925 [Zetaproteobacteria bacterium CG1_02_49_23]PIQ34879.1 MAG: hypothetical protein COW62_00410 [Zetaproteobacteria bacterium CG17_big_fil_post_rev_8_21_14_2_50_50_13]PIV31198.1 MAG: hypothetical protein COS35_02675 [Zetaproteobacteria bacterium CG02_land_8_20_14_3_00_50_9]PIY55833.1 MAG: hypothetical protein COZ00_07660 [Zetaproteobacteria bacterium CG_4_10_14_0_8_um_filter_49_80]PJA36239.1 MAG: hypothetical protein CO186_01960 [Zetaproteobacteria bacterium
MADTSLASVMPIDIPRDDFDRMLAFARLMHRLKDNTDYLDALADSLPATATVKTSWPSLLMGFDFHLTPDGPKLIEINNNAGGLYVGAGLWLPQCDNAEFTGDLMQRVLAMFPEQWQAIAIMDEDIEQQFMFPEMCAYADVLRAAGRKVFLVSPEGLTLRQDGLYCEQMRIDAIYNRHTDFYLESEPLAHIRQAYMQGLIELNPHPRSYALIGDKLRMVDWWQKGLLERCLSEDEVQFIRQITPETLHLAQIDEEEIWQDRKYWVFKPSARHGGKGVLMGKSVSRARFADLDRTETVAQRWVPASMVNIAGQELKLDIRLYMHGTKLIALAGRAWRGQVTNFREPGSGWVILNVV